MNFTYRDIEFLKTVHIVPDPPPNGTLTGLKNALPFLILFWGLVGFVVYEVWK